MRLTKSQKDRAVNSYVNDKTDKKISELKKAMKNQGTKLLKSIIPKDIQALSEESKNHLATGDSIRIDVNGYDDSVWASEDFVESRYGYIYKVDKTNKLYLAYIEAEKAVDEARSIKESCRQKFHNMIFGRNTLKSILAVAPELKKYLPTENEKVNALSIRDEDLMKALNNFPTPLPSAANKKGAGKLLREAKNV
jgi:hypothetical protein